MKTFQNIFKPLFFSLLLSIGLTSCGSDDDNSPANQGPNSLNLIQVADGSLNVELKPTFSWSAATNPDGSAISYDLYLDTNNPPTTKVVSNLSNTIYTLENNLEYGEVYNWKVVAKNDSGSTDSQIASFKTRAVTTIDLLIGKWFYDNIEITGDPDPTILSDCYKTSFVEFLVGDIMTITTNDINANGDCELDKIVQNTYVLINETTLQITDANGDSEPALINSISENILVLIQGTVKMTFIKDK